MWKTKDFQIQENVSSSKGKLLGEQSNNWHITNASVVLIVIVIDVLHQKMSQTQSVYSCRGKQCPSVPTSSNPTDR